MNAIDAVIPRCDNEAILVTRINGQIIDCNECAVKMYAYPSSHALKQRELRDLIPECGLEFFPKFFTPEHLSHNTYILHVTKRRNGELFACKIITYYQLINGEKYMISHIEETQTNIPFKVICLQQNILVLKRELEKERNLNRYNQLKEQSQQLLSRYPALSHKDLQLCKYILQNWSAQEIAGKLNITVNGVFAARKRLRKKMKLDPGSDLLNALIDVIQ